MFEARFFYQMFEQDSVIAKHKIIRGFPKNGKIVDIDFNYPNNRVDIWVESDDFQTLNEDPIVSEVYYENETKKT